MVNRETLVSEKRERESFRVGFVWRKDRGEEEEREIESFRVRFGFVNSVNLVNRS